MDSSRLVFVAGLHRSGTTPLARLLSGHPLVSGFEGTGAKEDEGQHLQDVYPSARAFGGAGRFALDPRSHLTELSPRATAHNAGVLMEQWSQHWDLAKPYLVEKSPPNLVMTRFLQALFPEARMVAVVRHPIVVALSTQKWMGPAAKLAPLLRHWIRAHEIFLADAAHLRHLHILKYEQLVAEPAATLAGLAAFLGLDGAFAGQALDGRRSDGYVETWTELSRSPAPWTRWRMARLRSQFSPGVGAFGYDFDDLSHLGKFPDPPSVSLPPT